MKTRQSDSIEISIRDVLWKLLEQWRAVLIVAVIIGLLCMSVMHFRNVRAWESAQQQVAALQETMNLADEQQADPLLGEQAVIESQLASLPQSDQNAVRNLLSMRQTLRNLHEYHEKSALSNLDATNLHVLCLGYGIRLTEEDEGYRMTLVSAYQEMLPQLLTPAVAEALDTDMEEQYVRELISVSEPKEKGTGAEILPVLTVQIILPEETDTDLLDAEVQKAVLQESQNLNTSICEHSLAQYENAELFLSDDNLLYQQAQRTSQMAVLTTYLANAEATLSGPQQTAYQKIRDIIENESTGETQDQTPANPRPGISLKWFAAGFVIGIVLYAIIYVIWMIMIRRLRIASEVSLGWDARILGELYRYDRQGGARFFNSKGIFRLRYRKEADFEQQLESIADSVKEMSHHMGLSRVVFVPVLSNAQLVTSNNWNEMREVLGNRFGDESFDAAFVTALADGKRIDEKQISDADGLVPVIIAGKTRPELLDTLLSATKVYDITPLGAVWIQG